MYDECLRFQVLVNVNMHYFFFKIENRMSVHACIYRYVCMYVKLMLIWIKYTLAYGESYYEIFLVKTYYQMNLIS